VFHVTRHDTAEAFASMAGPWGRLSEGGAGNVFLTHAWLAEWWRVYGQGRALRMLAASNGDGSADGDGDGDGVAAILPLVLEPGRGRSRRLAIMGGGEVSPNHLDLVAASGAVCPGVGEAFCEQLWQSRRDWDVLELVSVADGSALHRELPEAFRRHGCDVRVTLYTRCAHAVLAGSTFDEFLLKLGQNTRHEFRRKRRKLLRDHPSTRFGIVGNEDELSRVFGELVRLHQARWTRLGDAGSFASRQFSEFHRAASREVLRRGWLRMYYLESEGQVVAVLYCFRVGASVFYYAGGFDEAWKRHSVGVQLLGHAIEQSIAEGAADFDFLQGDEDYKSHWCTGWRDNWRITVAAPHLRGRLVGWGAATGDRLLALWRKHLPLDSRRKIKGLLRRGAGGGGARMEDRKN
jgi:CelD/BcsL family acetyltransferase involved in cellulose biosynthesis